MPDNRCALCHECPCACHHIDAELHRRPGDEEEIGRAAAASYWRCPECGDEHDVVLLDCPAP